MADVNLNDIWNARVVCYTSDQIALNSRLLHVSAAGVDPQTDQVLADALDARIRDAYKSCMSEDARYRGVSVQRVFPGDPTVPAITISSDGPGTSVAAVLPKQVSGLISFTTEFAGRKFRGRNYVPFPSELHSEDEGMPTAAYVALLQALANLWDTGFSVGAGGAVRTMTPVLVPVGFAAPVPLVDGIARNEFATQRKRGGFGRRNVLPF